MNTRYVCYVEPNEKRKKNKSKKIIGSIRQEQYKIKEQDQTTPGKNVQGMTRLVAY